jgi:hypothetical protein
MDTIETDIPLNDIECWERYPKHRWVYDLSRLLDAQNIDWSLYKTQSLTHSAICIDIDTDIEIFPAHIFIKEPTGDKILTELCIVKGEIKYSRSLDISSKSFVSINGNIELQIAAFISMYFQKYSGIISMTTIGSHIYSISLKSSALMPAETNAEVIKLLKKIYRKTI